MCVSCGFDPKLIPRQFLPELAIQRKSLSSSKMRQAFLVIIKARNPTNPM
jgi:hypothetical protein